MANKMHPLRLKLRVQKEFNPFHDEFDENLIAQELDDLMKRKNELTEEDILMFATLESALSLNLAYKEAYEHLKESFNKINLTYSEIVGFSMAVRNRTYWLINQERFSRDKDSNESHFEDSFRHKVAAADPTMGKLDSSAALETEVDSMHIVLNYLKYFKDKLPNPSNEIPKLQSIEQIKSQSFTSVFYYVLKSSYEDAIWRDGYAHFDIPNKELRIDFKDTFFLRIYKAGVYRLERNAMNFFFVGKRLIDQHNFEPLMNLFPVKKPGVRILNVRVSNGYIKYKLGDGKDLAEVMTEVSDESSLMAYYSFLENVDLPKLPNFTIRKLLGLFILLTHLFKKALLINIKDKGIFKKSDLFGYPFRIEVNNLTSYLLRRSEATEEDVRNFLAFIEAKERVNLWNEPLVKIDDDYFFLLLPLTVPNVLYQIDLWLDKGGFNLDERGKYFERHIKQTVSEVLSEKKYQFSIGEKSKYFNSKNEFEEIDLILILKSRIIIAEIKCIRYPFEPREISNAFLRIQKGVEQLKRKVNFVTSNSRDLETDIGSIKGKEIVPLIIVNYPMFTGLSIENIPIVDFYLLEAYMVSGKLMRGKMTMQNGREVSTEMVTEIVYYSNEDEFCSNLYDKMKSPPSVLEILPLIELEDKKITPDELNYQVFVKSAEFSEKE